MDSNTLWIVFAVVVGVLLVLDLGVLHRRQREIGATESLVTTGVYMLLAVLFGGFLWWERGAETALAFYTGYAVEFSLSMDNVFVMALILGMMHIPRTHQHRVLLYGVLGVIVLRGVMIALGATLVEQFHWTLYIMAAFLVFTGLQMLRPSTHSNPLSTGSPVLNFCRKHLRVTEELHGKKFFVRLPDKKTGKPALYMTPLFMALLMVELADVVFAFDSVPAIFAITTDTYVILTSNIFAILGLRSLYFALSAILQRFAYMKYALAILLVFIGGKVLVFEALLGSKFPPVLSLVITILILFSGVGYSWFKTRKGAPKKR
ncbi:MAG TPA: TerC/Alx family metal homeostasis membrane protein [Alphaproteobacteria bacterium]|nr:TerC/Alx family metal homeostasis membrane protein [Alphaproteobacteria bacterium]